MYYLNHGRLTKPNDAEWFHVLYPVEAQDRFTSLKNLNLANPWTKTVIDQDNYEYRMYFTSLQNFQAFLSYSASLPLSDAWHAYNLESDIIETILFRGYVEVDPATLESMT